MGKQETMDMLATLEELCRRLSKSVGAKNELVARLEQERDSARAEVERLSREVAKWKELAMVWRQEEEARR